jgi:hypothetical protein
MGDTHSSHFHLLFFYREIRGLENLTDFDRVTGFGRARCAHFTTTSFDGASTIQ